VLSESNSMRISSVSILTRDEVRAGRR